MSKLKHSPGPWWHNPADGCIWSSPSDQEACDEKLICQSVDDAHAEILSRALEVPHECADPACPGDINRRIVGMFGRMLHALCDAQDAIHNCGWKTPAMTEALGQARMVIGDAEQIVYDKAGLSVSIDEHSGDAGENIIDPP
jgi:hypothetical protein